MVTQKHPLCHTWRMLAGTLAQRHAFNIQICSYPLARPNCVSYNQPVETRLVVLKFCFVFLCMLYFTVFVFHDLTNITTKDCHLTWFCM